jgi:hypothetical protein
MVDLRVLPGLAVDARTVGLDPSGPTPGHPFTLVLTLAFRVCVRHTLYYA